MDPADRTEFNIRRAESSDAAEWLRLRLALWPEDSVAAHREQMADVRGSAEQIALVLERADGRLGGFVEVSIHPRAIGCATHNVAYVEGWYVDPDLRRRGLGSQLMRAAELWARQRGAAEIASDAQLDNEVSRQGHLRLGYAEVGRLIHFAKRLEGVRPQANAVAAPGRIPVPDAPPSRVAIRAMRPGEDVDCERVLRSLPDWFGIEESLRQYVVDTRRFETLVADDAGRVVGFVTLRRHFPEAGEVHCLAVSADRRGQGIGRALVAAVEERLRADGAAYVQVKTMGPSRPNAEYAQSLAFYRAMGFSPLEEFHGLWGAIPCLLLVKRLALPKCD